MCVVVGRRGGDEQEIKTRPGLKMMKSEAASIMKRENGQKGAGKRVQTWCGLRGAKLYTINLARKHTKSVMWTCSI